MAAVFAGLAANSAGARAAPEGTEAARLTFAEGRQEGERVRVIAGEVDGRGLLYVEHYVGERLRFAVPYTRVHIDGEERSIRELRALAVAPRQTADGFAFTAAFGDRVLACTVLLWSDATATCTRDPAYVPPGDPACTAAYAGHDQRRQCVGLRVHFPRPAIPHDELLAACTRAFRWELFRTNCLREGYNNPDIFADRLAACSSAYRTETERNFCIHFTLTSVGSIRVPATAVRACEGRHRTDAATTACVFQVFGGKHPDAPVPPAKPSRSAPPLPTDHPTAPLRLASRPRRVLHGAQIMVAVGRWQDHELRATGGFIGTEPVLWTDAFRGGAHRWMNPIDRLAVGGEVRAFREVTALDKLRMQGDVLTFRATVGGKRLSCRADATKTFARCR